MSRRGAAGQSFVKKTSQHNHDIQELLSVKDEEDPEEEPVKKKATSPQPKPVAAKAVKCGELVLVGGINSSTNYSLRTSKQFGKSKAGINTFTIYTSFMGSTSPVIGKKSELTADSSMSQSRDELRGSLGAHFPGSSKFGQTSKRKKLFGSGFKTYDQKQQHPFSATTNDFGISHSIGLNDLILEAKTKQQSTRQSEKTAIDKTYTGTNVSSFAKHRFSL